MNGIMSPELLAGFVAEARGYILALRNDLETTNGSFGSDVLHEMHRKAQILSNGARALQMDEIASLSQPVLEMLESCLKSEAALNGTERASLVAWFDEMDTRLVDMLGLDASENPAPPAPDLVLPPQFSPSAELLEIFALEASEHMQTIQTNLNLLHESADNPEALRHIRRAAHTLKGASAAVGLETVTRLSHLAEELIDQTIEHGIPLDGEGFDLLVDTEEALAELLTPGNGHDPAARLTVMDERYQNLLGDAYPFADESPASSQAISKPAGGSPHIPAVEGMLRMPLASIDVLINRVGEVIINRAMVEASLTGLRGVSQELDYSARRLQRVARDIDAQIEMTAYDAVGSRGIGDATFDPIELDRYSRLYQLVRELEESVADTNDANHELSRLTDDMTGGLTRERRLTSEVQEHLITARLVPFRELEPRLRLTLQRTTRDRQKQVDLNLIGLDITVDKNILNALADPLMHLLRNAVDHGIESPAERATKTKPPTGLITLVVARERNHIVVGLSDDGSGIDFERVRKRGIDSGRLAPDESADIQRLTALIFEDGFSISETVTETSGRGVGLNIVERAIRSMQGTIDIDSTPGQGTTFVVTVPVSLAIMRTMYVRCSNETYSLPLDQISSVLRLTPDTLEKAQKNGILQFNGRSYALYDLAAFIGSVSEVAPQRRYGLVVEAGQDTTVVLVDALAGVHETVVKSLGTHLRRISGVTGATISATGQVVLILDLMEVIGLTTTSIHSTSMNKPSYRRSQEDGLHVLVVDDSLSIRHVVESLLNRCGWQVTTAKDGIEALDKLATTRPDVALVDIEMPRMNGYELLSRMKGTANLQHIPVVFLTSRAAAKHRDRALELGVDAYLVKPYRDDELLDTLKRATAKQLEVG